MCGSCAAPQPDPFQARLEGIARDVGALRGLEIAGLDWRLERIAEQLEALLLGLAPTAAQLVQEGLSVEAALAEADRQTLRIRRLLGVDERSLRLSGLIV